MKRALLIVDLQNDFMPGGALGVKGGDEIVPLINQLIDEFDCVVASQDWHPSGHVSFAETHGKKVGETLQLDGVVQELWPVHCVQETEGAAVVNTLRSDQVGHFFYKGTDPQIDSYSAFFDNDHEHATGLNDYLRKKGVESLYLVGLTTDFCVLYSALDALELGYEVSVIRDACCPVFNEEEALKKIKAQGGEVITSCDLIKNPIK